jgi:hypothetical protein
MLRDTSGLPPSRSPKRNRVTRSTSIAFRGKRGILTVTLFVSWAYTDLPPENESES